jgi:asparagine synthase (glutamine-hydrolysing)
MCGIAGFINMGINEEDAKQLIDNMCEKIHHRGPNERGTWVENDKALGMTRLSIIDVPGGQQPIFNEDRSVLVVFNGEIYNYKELKARLEQLGHQFRTKSDTESIVHAYEEYGDDCVKHLRGMFSFAIWDRNRQRLLLARDRFAKKPLNYYWDGKRFIFGSEIKSILEAGVEREVNPIALDEYLVYRYVPAPNTMFKNIMKVPPAHIMVVENGRIETRQYWDLSFVPSCNDDEETAIEHIRELIKDAIKVRLMSEVPLGAFLSGGIDSSLMVGYMSQMIDQPVRTFTIGFDEADFSEVPYARQMAKRFGTDHHEFFVRPNLLDVLPKLAWGYDEPFGDASALSAYYVAKLAKENVSVILAGDGSDELFGGYTHYQREQAIDHIPGWARQAVGTASLLMPDGMRGKRRMRSLTADLPTRYVQGTMVFPVGTRERMYRSDYFEQLRDHNPYVRQTSQFQKVRNLDVVSQMQYVDSRNYLIDDIMVKVDKACMLNSLEVRAPFMDQYLAEYVASLPVSYRVNNGKLKYLLKKAASEILPPEILNRKKQGFSVPLKYWFRGELSGFVHDTLESKQARERGIFNPQFVHHLLETHKSNRAVDHSSSIWVMLCLELWFRAYIDSPTPTADQKLEISLSKK